jgi:hypothetical protein
MITNPHIISGHPSHPSPEFENMPRSSTSKAVAKFQEPDQLSPSTVHGSDDDGSDGTTEWVLVDNVGMRPFPRGDSNEPKDVVELFTQGSLVSNKLDGDEGYPPSVRITISTDEVERLKAFIMTYPKFDPQDDKWQWPIKNEQDIIVRDKEQERHKWNNTSKQFDPFRFVWDGRGASAYPPKIEERRSIAIHRLTEGSTVFVEFTPIIWRRDGHEGVTLELLSVGLLKEGRGRESSKSGHYNVDSPNKKMRMAQ